MNVSSVKNLNGETFSAVQDVALTDIVSSNSANWNEISAYQANSGDYLTTADSANFYTTANESGFITGVDLTPYQLTADMTAYQPAGDYYSASNPSGFITGLPDEEEVEFEEIDLTDYQPVSSMTAYQPVGDYLTTGDSANFYTTANESGFITNDAITGKQDITGMTAYQPVGSYLTTADSANFYTTANESGFISEVPDTYLQNTDLSTTDGKVTAISGIPLSAGGAVPEGVMVESGLEYNAVNEISGYNGSAIAQYGAEKQWLVHDDTLVHAANSAQYALGVNLSAVAQLLGVDETVLWEDTTPLTAIGQTFTLNEPVSSFSKLKFVMSMDQTTQDVILETVGNYCGIPFSYMKNNNAAYEAWLMVSFSGAKTGSILSTKCMAWNLGSTAKQPDSVYNNWEWTTRALRKIIGIGRKQ